MSGRADHVWNVKHTCRRETHHSRDWGQTWEPLPAPVSPNGTIWHLATHAADPDVQLASSVNGQVFCSSDTGNSWRKFSREFGEVHALAWAPN